MTEANDPTHQTSTKRATRWSTEPRPSYPIALQQAQRRLTRGRAGAIVGAVSGLVLAVALCAVTLTSDALGVLNAVQVAGLVVEAAAACPLGAFIGALAGGGRLAHFLQTFLGYRPDAERVRAELHGEGSILNPAQQLKAAQYADIAQRIYPAQYHRHLLLIGSILLGELGAFAIAADGTDLLPALAFLAPAFLQISTVQLRRRMIKQARRYSATHPLP